MPFGPFKDFADCVAKNQDRRDPDAYCAVIQRAIEGQEMVVTEASEGKKFLLNVEIFQTGVHVPQEGEVRLWTAGELQDIVRAFEAHQPEVVHLKIGHTSEEFCELVARKLGVPVELVKGEGPAGNGMVALGKVVALRLREDGVMVADFEAPAPVADLIAKGYTDVSVELAAGFPDHPWVLSAVALLGAERPAVKGLAGLENAAALCERQPVLVTRFQAAPGGLVQFQNDPARICGNIWFKGTDKQRGAFGGGSEGRGREEKPPEAWWDDCVATVGGKFGAQPGGKTELEELEEVNAAMEQVIKGKKAAHLLQGIWGQVRERWAALLGQDHFTAREADVDTKKLAKVLKMQEGATEEAMMAKMEQMMEVLAAIAQAVGVGGGGEVPPGEMAAKVKELAEKAKTATFAEGKYAEQLQAATARIGALERDKRLAAFQEVTRGLTALEGKPDTLAAELLEVEDKLGKDAATRTVARWQQTQKLAQDAGLMRRIGTAREGGGDMLPVEAEMAEWAKANNKTQGEAYAHFREHFPDKWRTFRAAVSGNGAQ